MTCSVFTQGVDASVARSNYTSSLYQKVVEWGMSIVSKKSTTPKETTTKKNNKETKQNTTTEEATTEEVTTEIVETDNRNKTQKYRELADREAEWLWSQQMSNGAFAFYNAPYGTVSINPYFSEIVAISLIRHDDSKEAGNKIKKYLDWHFAHINSAQDDYNGLEGTIYDYTADVVNGVVVEERTNRTYDSTDSYSALFIKVLADYVKTYGDSDYVESHNEDVKAITDVMFATMKGGYTYAKPDYAIRYLMDNSEVFAGLESAEYIYASVIDDDEMYKKVSKAAGFYRDNFNNDWWKGGHYATVLNFDNSEYTGFALLAAQQGDTERFDRYIDRYQQIVDGGRMYPLYSAESAMVLNGLNEMIENN